ncbi:Protein GLUTAMINE DUMPER 2 [Bienertia sinuspersici]
MRWNSPIPYLFGGLALILGLISIALMILACSYLYKKKHDLPSSFTTGTPANINDMVVLDNVPKVVVIMAGDDKPTYIATPMNISSLADDSISPSLSSQPPTTEEVDGEFGMLNVLRYEKMHVHLQRWGETERSEDRGGSAVGVAGPRWAGGVGWIGEVEIGVGGEGSGDRRGAAVGTAGPRGVGGVDWTAARRCELEDDEVDIVVESVGRASTLVLLMGLIATALLLLACSYRKRLSTTTTTTTSTSTSIDEERIGWHMSAVPANPEPDTKPKIVVVMAGDDKPSFFAAPTQLHAASSNHICRCGSQV